MSSVAYATVTPVTDAAEEEKFHWIVMFQNHGKVYPYLNRTVQHMTGVVQRFRDEHNRFPYRMWVIVEGEIQKVEIK